MDRLTKASVWLAALLLALPAIARAQVSEEAAASVRELMAEYISDETPGYAVGVVVDDEVVFTHYAGLANLDTPTPIDEKTRFNIASVTKQYTALMVLDLARAGKIDLDEDFRTYLPDAMPGVEERITIAQMLTHTSGIRDVYDLFFLTGETWYEYDFSSRTARDLLDTQTDLNFAPGTDALYSNSNYILLADVVAAVTGEPFPAYGTAFLNERGMTDTVVRRRYGVVVPRLARAYGNYGSGWVENADIANTYGDGFIYTSLPDQMRWETQIWGHDQTLPGDLIAASQVPIEGLGYEDYGYGLEFDTYRGLKTVYHEGATGAYNSYTVRFPEIKTSVITMGNTSQVNAVWLAYRVAERLLEGQFPSDDVFLAGPETFGEFNGFEEYLGLYQLGSGTFVRLVEKDGELYREIEGRDPVRMIYEEENVFSYETIPDLKLVLSKTESGEQEFALYSPTQASQFARFLDVEPVPNDPAYASTIEASFVNPETGTEITLRHVEGQAFKMIKTGRERDLSLIAKDYLYGFNYSIRVLRDEEGVANGLLVDRGRIRNVAFRRTDMPEKKKTLRDYWESLLER